MNSAQTAKIIKKLALKYRLPEPVIKKIVHYQFQFVRDKMGEGVKGDYETFPAIRLYKFGFFLPRKGMIEALGDGSRYEAKKRDIYRAKYGKELDDSEGIKKSNKDDGTTDNKE